MWLKEAHKSTVIKGTVGSGGTNKGSMCVLSSNTFIKITDAPTDLTVVGIALETSIATDVIGFELVSSAPIITAKYTGSSKTSLTDADISKVFDVSDDLTVDLDDTSGGPFMCVGYDNDNDTIDFIVMPADRAV